MTQSADGPELVPLSEDPDCREAALPALDAWITPTDRFYIRSHFTSRRWTPPPGGSACRARWTGR